MINLIKYNYILNRLVSKRLIQKEYYSSKIKKARRNNVNDDDVSSIVSELQFEDSIIKEDIATLTTNYLINIAV